MRVDLLPGLVNVIRFPVERRARPTLDLMRSLAPDAREVSAVAVVVGLDLLRIDVRAVADANAAEHIRAHLSSDAPALAGALDALLDPLVVAAIAVSWSARDMATATAEARQALLQARTSGEGWLAPLHRRAETLRLQAVELLVQAYACGERAEGVARAVGYARRGELWTPRADDGESAAALALALRRSAYKAELRTSRRQLAPPRAATPAPPESRTSA